MVFVTVILFTINIIFHVSKNYHFEVLTMRFLFYNLVVNNFIHSPLIDFTHSPLIDFIHSPKNQYLPI